MIRLTRSLDSVIRRWPTENARQWLAGLLRRVEGDENVLAVVAVGSAIRPGVPSEDLDLVVLCADRTAFQVKAPIEVDLRAYDRADIDASLERGHDLLAWAVRFGVPLHDPRGTWRDIVHKWGDRLPLPDPELAERRAETALERTRELEQTGDRTAAAELRLSYLTHRARATLSRFGVYPASRPELPEQLRSIGVDSLAEELARALSERRDQPLERS
jgi:hypothetical protein